MTLSYLLSHPLQYPLPTPRSIVILQIQQWGMLTIARKVGPNNQLFGAVTNKQLMELVKEKFGEHFTSTAQFSVTTVKGGMMMRYPHNTPYRSEQIRTKHTYTHDTAQNIHSQHSTKHTLTTQHITSHHRIEHTYTHHTPQNRTNTFLSSFLFILHPLVHYSTPTHSSHPLSDIVFSPGLPCLPCLPLGCDESGGNCSLDIGDNDLRKTGTYSAFIKVSSMS